MKKTIMLFLMILLSQLMVAQNYHELSRDHRRTITCDGVLELSDGNIVFLEDEGYLTESDDNEGTCPPSGNGEWVYSGLYLMKMNNKAELLDSLYIEFPHTIKYSALINNPFEEGSNIFAQLYYDYEELKYYYKAVFFDNDLNITEMVDVAINTEAFLLYSQKATRRLYLDLNGDWLISAENYDCKYVFLTMDLWGNLLREKTTDISTKDYIPMHEHLFVFDKNQELYGFYCSNELESNTKNLFVIDMEFNIVASHSINRLDDVKIFSSISSINNDSMFATKETGEIVMIARVTKASNIYFKYLQITEFDKNMNVIRYKRLDKNIVHNDQINTNYSSLSIRKDGSIYINWYIHIHETDYTQHYVTCLDKDLNIVWETPYFESNEAWIVGNPVISAMRILKNGNLVMAGTGLSSHDYSDWNSTHPMVYVFEENTIGVTNDSYVTHPYSIYPNPASDIVKISSDSGQLSVVKVYNCLGMLVEEMEVNASEVEINVSDYNSGIYFIEVDGIVSKFVVK